MNPIYLRGLGAVSAYGRGLARVGDALVRGDSALRPFTRFPLPGGNKVELSAFPDDVAGALSPAALHGWVDDAIAEAAAQARDFSLRDCALVVGTSGYLFVAEAAYRAAQAAGTGGALPQLTSPGELAREIAQRHGLDGPVLTVSTACSSSANAILLARDLIARGRAPRALVLGIEAFSRIALGGFQALMLLDPDGCKPFDAKRRGLQLGEAVVALLLGADGDAHAPQLLGGANLCDIHHVTSAAPDGAAMLRAMQQALADAGCAPHDIVAVKAHGTGSLDNDQAEAAALRALFGDAPPPIVALKRYTGHALGACGALEIASLAASLARGVLPRALGCETPDPALGIAPLRQSMPAPRGPYLYNFFGFGGNYAALVLRHA